jgi:hypothetical protein
MVARPMMLQHLDVWAEPLRTDLTLQSPCLLPTPLSCGQGSGFQISLPDIFGCRNCAACIKGEPAELAIKQSLGCRMIRTAT